MTLDAVPAGTSVVLARPKVAAARERRLAELGLRAGERVTVLHRVSGGGRLLAVDDARIALGPAVLRAFPVIPVSGPDRG